MALNTGINSLDAGAPELRLEGEQQAGGIYNQGSDVKNALAAWANMGPEDRAGFEGFLDFFRTGAWRDQIQGMRRMERDRRTASAPDPQDEMNSFSMEIFGKPLHQLAPEELQELQDLAREQAAGGGRIGLKGGQLVQPGLGRPGYGGPHETEEAGRAYEEAVSRGEGAQHQQQALQQFAQLPTTRRGGADSTTGDSYINRQIKKVPGFGLNLSVAKRLNLPYLIAAYGVEFVKNKLRTGELQNNLVDEDTLEGINMLSWHGI